MFEKLVAKFDILQWFPLLLLAGHLMVLVPMYRAIWRAIQTGSPIIKSGLVNRGWAFVYLGVVVFVPCIYLWFDWCVFMWHLPAILHVIAQVGVEFYFYAKVAQGRIYRFFVCIPLMFVFARVLYVSFLFTIRTDVMLCIVFFFHVLDYHVVMLNVARYLFADEQLQFARGSAMKKIDRNA